MNTGHDGSMSTGHANSAADMLSRLENICLLYTSAQALMDDPAEMFGNLRRYREKYRQEKEMLQTAGSEVDVYKRQADYRSDQY